MTAARGVREATLFPGYFLWFRAQEQLRGWSDTASDKAVSQPTDNPGKFKLQRDKNQWMFSPKKPIFQCFSGAALISHNSPKNSSFVVLPYRRHSKTWLPADPFGHWGFFTPSWLWKCFFHHQAFCPSC